ncbi:MAG: alpha/beta fold hydrolase [Chloroflexi bacterium]|nr:MAG: alpha/beta fold hydrolase [Chloroflexota bacterium]
MRMLEFSVFFLLLYFVIRPIYLAFLYTRPPRIRISFFTPTSLGVDYEDVTLSTRDEVDLKGWYIPSRNGAAVLLLHGHSGNRLAVLHQAEALIRAGYGCLMMDLRAHGHSGGRLFARSEVLVSDVLTAVAFLSKRPEVNQAGIGIYGVSDGGLFALQAAAKTVAIRALVVDGVSAATFDDYPPPQTFLQRTLLYPLQRGYLKLIDWFSKQPPLAANRQLIPQIAPRPIFFISTGNNVERRMVHTFHDEAGPPKSLWEIPEARHASGWLSHPELYDENLVRFFDLSLVSERDRSVEVSEFMPLKPSVKTLPDVPYPIESEATISFFWANVVALMLFPLAYVLLFVPYRWIWGVGLGEQILVLTWQAAVGMIVMLMLSIGVHEWIHGMAFVWVGGVAKTAVFYGFNWKGMAPYAHCKAPMRAAAYRIAVLLPGFLLGIVPGLIGVVTGIWWLLPYGMMMLVAAGGDTAVLLAMNRVPGDALVLDHPSQAGCLVLTDMEIEE